MKKFEIGKTYNCSYNGNREFAYVCTKRTEKSAWFKPAFGKLDKEIRASIKLFEGVENCFPCGGIISARF